MSKMIESNEAGNPAILVCTDFHLETSMKNQEKMTNNIKKNEKFHNSMKFLLVISQFFGLFPLHGLLSSSYKNMYFSWLSFRTMHTLLISVASFIHGVICAYFLMESNQPFQIFKLNIVLFYIRGAVTCLLFLKLAKNWPQLIKDFENVEIYLNNFPTSKCLATKLRIFTFTILVCAAVEHFSVHYMNFLIAYKCEKNLLGILRRFFAYINYRQVFTYFYYNIFLGVFLQILNISVTFGWTYADIFIIHASRNFSEKLVQLKNQIYLTINEGINSPEVWSRLQENYTRLLALFGILNKRLNNIILISFATNIYFLLTQLFSWTKTNGSETSLHHVYHALSTCLLVFRSVFVCFYGGSIKRESMKIKTALVTIPSTLYNNEIKRFILEVSVYPMVLTGNEYFYITRELILKIAGSIVTYELIMFQFSNDISEPPESPQC